MSDSESEASSVVSVQENNDTIDDTVEDLEESNYMNGVRNSIRDWKLREMDANANESSQPNGLRGLRNFVNKSAKLFYDLQSYLNTSKNDEQNMKDSLYVSIVNSIGVPATLSYHIRTLLDHILQRDLVELPFTVEPKVINSYAKKGYEVKTEFPDEE